jgi:hypothetical protein
METSDSGPVAFMQNVNAAECGRFISNIKGKPAFRETWLLFPLMATWLLANIIY